jgi:oligopeptide transport system ATP-binding protein
MMKLLEVKNLSVRYETRAGDVRALEDVSFSLDTGERLGVVGESGSGKSTLGFAILGLMPFPGKIKSGNIFFQGEDITCMRDRELEKIRGEGITMIFQDSRASLNPLMTVEEHFRDIFRYRMGNEQNRTFKDPILEILRDVGITDPEERLKQYPHQLSGGMAQRVLIALALVESPKVIIADEVTTGLDVTLQVQILNLLKELSQKRGTVFILISHAIGVVSYFSERIMVMYAGMIMEEGETREVLDHPYHPYTKALVASLPSGNKKRMSTIYGEPPSLLREDKACPFAQRCPFVKDICYSQKPPLRQRGKQNIACFFDV